MELLIAEDDPNDLKLALHAVRKQSLVNNLQIARDGQAALDFVFGEGEFDGRENSFSSATIGYLLNEPLVPPS